MLKPGQKSALEEKEKADAAKLEAEKYAQLAERNSQLANQEKDNATRFRMLAIAQAMGSKASQLQDRDQKVLGSSASLFVQQQYAGYPYQPDIYNGLYSAYQATIATSLTLPPASGRHQGTYSVGGQ